VTATFMTSAEPDEIWPLVRDFHYRRRMPAIVHHAFAWRSPGGLWGDFGDPLAAVIYSQPVSRNFPPNSMELSRLVRRDDFAEQLSQLVSWSLRWLRGHTAAPFVLSYADTTHGHHGGVYQACGFVYVGQSSGGHIGYEESNGSFVHGRICNKRFNTRSVAAMAQIKPNWAPIYGGPKHLYIFPLRQRLKSLLSQQGWRSLPYPKPNRATCLSDAPPPSGVSHEHTVEVAP